MPQHLANVSHVGVLCAQANQRGALSSVVGRMRRLAPVDVQRDDTVSHQHRRVCKLPQQLNSVRSSSGTGSHFAKVHAFAECLTSYLFQVIAVDEPGDESGFFESVEAEGTRSSGGG